MHRVIKGAVIVYGVAGLVGLFFLGCMQDGGKETPQGLAKATSPAPEVGRGDDDQPSRGICEILGDDDEPAFVVGRTPLPQDPRARAAILTAIDAARGHGKAPLYLKPAAGCAGAPHCDNFGTGIVHCSDGCTEWLHVRLEMEGESYEFCTDYRSGDQIYCPWSSRGLVKPKP